MAPALAHWKRNWTKSNVLRGAILAEHGFSRADLSLKVELAFSVERSQS
jgi:hypothetical protein